MSNEENIKNNVNNELNNQIDFKECNEETEIKLWGECYSIEGTTVLDLSSSKLTGEIPLDIVNLVNLKFLDLSNNQLTGEIPYDICYMVNLGQFLIDNNKFCSYPNCISDEEIGYQDQADCLKVNTNKNNFEQDNLETVEDDRIDALEQPQLYIDHNINKNNFEQDNLETVEQPIPQPQNNEQTVCPAGTFLAADGTCIMG